jgi:hypothetical protein
VVPPSVPTLTESGVRVGRCHDRFGGRHAFAGFQPRSLFDFAIEVLRGGVTSEPSRAAPVIFDFLNEIRPAWDGIRVLKGTNSHHIICTYIFFFDASPTA